MKVLGDHSLLVIGPVYFFYTYPSGMFWLISRQPMCSATTHEAVRGNKYYSSKLVRYTGIQVFRVLIDCALFIQEHPCHDLQLFGFAVQGDRVRPHGRFKSSHQLS